MTSAYPLSQDELVARVRAMATKDGKPPSQRAVMAAMKVSRPRAVAALDALAGAPETPGAPEDSRALHVVREGDQAHTDRTEDTPVEGASGETSPQPATVGDAPTGAPVAVDTDRVRALRAEVVEARSLLALQADRAPLEIDTKRVRRRRKRASEARALHLLGKDADARAWSAARWRFTLTVAGMASLVLALGWSTANVQRFAAAGASPWSASWMLAWLVEPFLSLSLLTVVGAKAFLATRGQPLDHPTLRKIEALFLGLTLAMNCWPYLPWSADPFRVDQLVLHTLGPIVAVCAVTALPIIWAAFADLDHQGKN